MDNENENNDLELDSKFKKLDNSSLKIIIDILNEEIDKNTNKLLNCDNERDMFYTQGSVSIIKRLKKKISNILLDRSKT